MCEDTHANQSHPPENNDGKEAVEKFGHSFLCRSLFGHNLLA
jgi:hypothetical protein